MCEVANTLLHLLLSPQLWRVLAAHPISKHRLQCRRQQRTKHGGDIKNSICFLGHLSQCRCRLPKYIPAQHWLGKTGSYFGSAASSRSRSHRAGAVQCTGTTSFINGTGHRMQVPHAPKATLGVQSLSGWIFALFLCVPGSPSSNMKEFSLQGTWRSIDERHGSRTRSDNADVYN